MWINTETLAVYRTPQHVRLGLKNVSFSGRPDQWPSQFASVSWEYGEEGNKQVGRVMPVTATPAPQYNSVTHELVESFALVGDVWTQQWSLVARDKASTDSLRESMRIAKREKIEKNLEEALQKRVAAWARTQFPQLVAQANQKLAQVNSSQTPEDIDTTIE